MNDTLTPQEAALVLTRASSWDDRIVHRTEGMTWMIWGLVTAAIWVTLSVASRLPMNLVTMTLAWAPWVLAGFSMTYALWRSAALSRPDVVRPAAWWTYPAKVVGILAGLFLLHYVVQPTTPAYPLALMGGLWIALAVLSRRWSRLGKATSLAIGLLVVIGGVLMPLLLRGMESMMLGAAAIAGVVPLLGGFWQTLRG